MKLKFRFCRNGKIVSKLLNRVDLFSFLARDLPTPLSSLCPLNHTSMTGGNVQSNNSSNCFPSNSDISLSLIKQKRASIVLCKSGRWRQNKRKKKRNSIILRKKKNSSTRSARSEIEIRTSGRVLWLVYWPVREFL